MRSQPEVALYGKYCWETINRKRIIEEEILILDRFKKTMKVIVRYCPIPGCPDLRCSFLCTEHFKSSFISLTTKP
jgi:hypothetical protein